MKNKPVVLLLVIGLISVQAYAQTAPSSDPTNAMTLREQFVNTTPEQRAERQTAQMKQKLALSTEQETTVAVINLKYARQMQPVIETGGRNLKTLKQVRSIISNKDGDLKKVLDKGQYTLYKDVKDEQRAQMKSARDRRRNR